MMLLPDKCYKNWQGKLAQLLIYSQVVNQGYLCYYTSALALGNHKDILLIVGFNYNLNPSMLGFNCYIHLGGFFDLTTH